MFSTKRLMSLLLKPQNPILVVTTYWKSMHVLGNFSEKNLSEGTHVWFSSDYDIKSTNLRLFQADQRICRLPSLFLHLLPVFRGVVRSGMSPKSICTPPYWQGSPARSSIPWCRFIGKVHGKQYLTSLLFSSSICFSGICIIYGWLYCKAPTIPAIIQVISRLEIAAGDDMNIISKTTF